MQKFLLAATAVLLLAANAHATDAGINLTLQNHSPAVITYENFTLKNNDVKRLEASLPQMEGNMSRFCFKFSLPEQPMQSGCLSLARASQAFKNELFDANELKVSFYAENGALYAKAENKSGGLSFAYKELLHDWGVVEKEAGLIFFQDGKQDLAAWKEAQERGDANWRAAWEPLYPGTVNDWLRSPMESRGFVMPTDKIYNVDIWKIENLFELQPAKQHWDEVDAGKLLVVKTKGDFGRGLLSFKNAKGYWFFVSYGFDGTGAYGGLQYRIDDKPPQNLKYAGPALPWQN